MPMKNPPHPGGIVRDALRHLGLSVTQAARALGMSRYHLNQVVREENRISPEMALRLEAVIGSTAGAWLRAQAAHDEARVRASSGRITKGLKRISRPARSRVPSAPMDAL